jgi:hypothetical protein
VILEASILAERLVVRADGHSDHSRGCEEGVREHFQPQGFTEVLHLPDGTLLPFTASGE